MNTSLVRENTLREHWANESKMLFNGRLYRVGKMSYGQYFLEPGEDGGEKQPFNSGTLWAELAYRDQRLYKLTDESEV